MRSKGRAGTDAGLGKANQFRASPEPDRCLLRLGCVFPVNDVVVARCGGGYRARVIASVPAGHGLCLFLLLLVMTAAEPVMSAAVPAK